MTSSHLMIDLETMGTTPDAAVLSIGAVFFDPYGDFPEDAMLGSNPAIFYRVCSLKGQFRTIDPDTVAWWMKQSDQARQAVFGAESMPLATAMKQFVDAFLPRDSHNLKVWAQGSSFDLVIVEDILRQYKQPIPWRFWNHRDTRTAYDMAGYDPPKATEVAHVAWLDAKAQARQVQAAYRAAKAVRS